MNPLQALYQLGLKLDQKITQPTPLPHPVVSVGNISVGGRAKTPFVIEVCLMLKEQGYHPVVLTRGYARESKAPVWLLPETLKQLQKILIEETGDEAVEIFLRAQVAVLISAQRAEQALKYAQQFKDPKTVFVLDDGFQHWKIARDLDCVIVNDFDMRDSLLPTGRLREGASALARAGHTWTLDKDLRKVIKIAHVESLSAINTIAVTTRAGSQKKYGEDLSRYVNFTVPVLDLKDHLRSAALERELLQLPTMTYQLLLGFKEAVKLLGPQELLQNPHPVYKIKIADRNFEIFLVELSLDLDRGRLLSLLQQKGIIK